MLSELWGMREVRVSQLEKQQRLDDQMSKLPCKETIIEFILVQRWMESLLSRQIYKETSIWHLYQGSQHYTQWRERELNLLQKILAPPLTPQEQCEKLKERLIQLKLQ